MLGYRTHAEPSVVRRAAEMWPEGVEQMPYATSWKPLYPFPGSPIMGGTVGSSVGSLAAQTPSTCNLEFVRGDSVSLSFFFPGVAWTATRPESGGIPLQDPPVVGGLPVAWEKKVWNAQIRDPDHHPADPCCYYNSWIPIWGGLPTNEQIKTYSEWTLLTEFMCTAEYVPGTTYGTLVTIELDNTVDGSDSFIYPADSYRWDLQMGSGYTIDPTTHLILDVLDPVTVLQGDVTVLADYTYKEQVVSS